MVFIDRASRWAEAYPLKNNNSEEMLAALLTFIWRRGCPKILFSDRGWKLLSMLASKVYERLGIKKESATAYRHNSSGMVERAIQTLLTLLSCTLAGELHHSSWLERLPAILWTMNSSVSASTGYYP
jgi:hypothetical protein